MNQERSTKHEELRGLCAAHALGALDPPESGRLEAHLREGCADCLTELEGHRRTVYALGSLSGEETPPARAEERLLERLGPGEPETSWATAPRAPEARGVLLRWLPLAAAVGIASLALWMVGQSREDVARLVDVNVKLLEQTSTQARENSMLVRGNQTLYEEGQRLHAVLDRAREPDVQAYELAGLEGTVHFGGWVFLDPRDLQDPADDICSVHTERMPPLPEGQTYQAWMVIGEEVHDLGTFDPDESGFGLTQRPIPAVSTFESVQVTIEPAGGARAPSGRVLLHHAPGGTP